VNRTSETERRFGDPPRNLHLPARRSRQVAQIWRIRSAHTSVVQRPPTTRNWAVDAMKRASQDFLQADINAASLPRASVTSVGPGPVRCAVHGTQRAESDAQLGRRRRTVYRYGRATSHPEHDGGGHDRVRREDALNPAVRRGLQRHRRGVTRDADSQLGGRRRSIRYALDPRPITCWFAVTAVETPIEDTAPPYHDRWAGIGPPWWVSRLQARSLALAATDDASGRSRTS